MHAGTNTKLIPCLFNANFFKFNLKAFNKEECMNMLDEGNVHLTTLDAGEVFIGGRYHSLIPLMQERLEGNLTDTCFQNLAFKSIFIQNKYQKKQKPTQG
jgi:hypothetical protein